MLSGGAAAPPEALERLFRDRPMGAMEWGLERIEALLAALDDPHRSFESLHIAGTNGKGSTALFAQRLLSELGIRTGLNTSPHLHDIRERFVVDGAPVPDEVLAEVAARMARLPETAPATYFEVATALAFAAFRAMDVEWAVVETGLGGRLDATNVLVPRASCVTTIGIDHADVLGHDLETIAGEKAGIFKPGIPAVLGRVEPPVSDVLERAARDVDAPLYRLGHDAAVDVLDVSLGGTAFRYRSQKAGELELAVAAIGAHQADNAAVALLGLEAAGVDADEADIRKALRAARVPGRFEVRRGAEVLWVLDVAHNPQGLGTALDTLAAVNAPRPRVAVVAMLADKPVEEMIGMLRLDMQAIILSRAPSAPEARRWDPAAAGRSWDADGGGRIPVEPDFARALDRAARAGAGGTVLVTGSTYTVGDARRLLHTNE